jgi:hypothetical protein
MPINMQIYRKYAEKYARAAMQKKTKSRAIKGPCNRYVPVLIEGTIPYQNQVEERLQLSQVELEHWAKT